MLSYLTTESQIESGNKPAEKTLSAVKRLYPDFEIYESQEKPYGDEDWQMKNTTNRKLDAP